MEVSHEYPEILVLIPMWWGDFSEEDRLAAVIASHKGLNPHVVGRFFRESCKAEYQNQYIRLNPHVVGRFFRVEQLQSRIGAFES